MQSTQRGSSAAVVVVAVAGVAVVAVVAVTVAVSASAVEGGFAETVLVGGCTAQSVRGFSCNNLHRTCKEASHTPVALGSLLPGVHCSLGGRVRC